MDAVNEALLAISGLQHDIYCPRQRALIHVEQQWAESDFTADGQIFHRRALMAPERDSLRLYFLGNHYETKVLHFGVRPSYAAEGVLML